MSKNTLTSLSWATSDFWGPQHSCPVGLLPRTIVTITERKGDKRQLLFMVAIVSCIIPTRTSNCCCSVTCLSLQGMPATLAPFTGHTNTDTEHFPLSVLGLFERGKERNRACACPKTEGGAASPERSDPISVTTRGSTLTTHR